MFFVWAMMCLDAVYIKSLWYWYLEYPGCGIYLTDCKSFSVWIGNSGCLETQARIVGRLLVGLVLGFSWVETGMWSDVAALSDRGSHKVRVCGVRLWRVEVKRLP